MEALYQMLVSETGLLELTAGAGPNKLDVPIDPNPERCPVGLYGLLLAIYPSLD